MKVAYLAPEIPALSATFVYKEIQTLESLGVEIFPFSIHEPFNEASEKSLDALKQKTVFVYQNSLLNILVLNLFLLVSVPVNYISSFFMLFTDMLRMGLITRKSLGLVYRFLYAAKVATDLRERECKHIHVHFAHVPTDVAMYASKMIGGSYSVTSHANDLFERGWLLKQKVERSLFFGTISDFNKRFLSGLGIDTSKVKIVRCGVDEAQFSPRTVEPNNKSFKIGLVARLVEKKGIDTLILAISNLIQAGHQIQLLIAGSGPLEADLVALKNTQSLTDEQVHFIGPLPHSEIDKFVKSLDIFVLPCKRDANGDMDGIPVVLMESMLSGVPVISTKLSGIPELVIHRETGLLIEPNDESALASAILEIISDKQLKQNVIANAIVKVRSEFSININAKRLKKLFSNEI